MTPATLRSRLALLFALLALFLSAWIVVPAPTRALLPLGVGAPEVSALLAMHALFAAASAMPDLRTRRASRVAAIVAAIALLLALIPFVRFPGAAARARESLEAVTGLAVESGADEHAPFRGSPLVALDLFRGLGASDARVTRDVVVDTIAGESLTADVYEPGGAAPPGAHYPILVQIYGGAWQRGEPSDFGEFAQYFAARGYVVFAIDYRHAPAFRYPAQLDDVRRALGWIGANGARFHADTSRIVLLGRSAGAHLAMLAAYTAPDPRIRGVVSLYGPVDLVEGYRSPPRPDPLRVREVEEAFLGGTPSDMPDRYREASPVTYATRALPPTLLVYGGRDHIVEPRFGRQLRDRLQATGTPVVHVEIPWAEHAFDAVPHGPSGQLARWTTERFLAWAVR